jgi:hypothetical protein
MIREGKMTGIDPDRLERRLRWAAEQLGLSPHASLEAVRAAWLRRLPAEEFVPSSELSWALAALLRRQSEGGWEARADEAAAVAEEERLRSEVEAFAAGFWDLPPDGRRSGWRELLDRAKFTPALRERLRLLELGLGCVPFVDETKEDTRVIELAYLVRDLFVLRPRPSARAQQDVLERVWGDRRKWRKAGQRLRRGYPKLASLGKGLLVKMEKAPLRPTPFTKGRAFAYQLMSPEAWALLTIGLALVFVGCVVAMCSGIIGW